MSIKDLIQEYYAVLNSESFDEGRLRTILSPELDFEGSIAGHFVGAEPFIKGAAGFAEAKSGMTMIHQVFDGDTAATLYDAEMPGGAVRFAEFFTVADDKIQSLRLHYDATEYNQHGGR